MKVKEMSPELFLRTIEGRRKGEQQRMRWRDGITDSTDVNLSKLQDSEGQGSLARCSPWGHRVRHDLAIEQWAKDTLLKYLLVTKSMKSVSQNHKECFIKIPYCGSPFLGIVLVEILGAGSVGTNPFNICFSTSIASCPSGSIFSPSTKRKFS